MSANLPSKYGAALTGSDWVGLPLRIGHVPDNGAVEDLHTETDAVLVWTGGPSKVTVRYENPVSRSPEEHEFERLSGMMDLMPRGTKLLGVEWKGKPSICVSVNFPESALRALCSTEGAGLVPESGPQFGLMDAHVVDLVRRLQAQAEGEAYLGAVYVQSISLALASYIAARYGAGASSEPPSRPARLTSEQKNRIEQFIDHALPSNFGLVDLARVIGYSPDHFSRLFKHAYQQSPYQYVMARRIEKAMTMLRDDTLQIAKVASECGFSNQGHFTTAFKRRTGLTPSAYRKT